MIEVLSYMQTRQVRQPYPFPYGFVLVTRCEDGEGVDYCILTADRPEADTVVDCRPDPSQGNGSEVPSGTSIEMA